MSSGGKTSVGDITSTTARTKSADGGYSESLQQRDSKEQPRISVEIRIGKIGSHS